MEHKAKISENGRILIPTFNTKPTPFELGDEVIMRITNNELRLISTKNAIKKA